MKYLSLDLIKKQCIVDEDFEEDDGYLLYLGDVAEQLVEKDIDCSLEEVAEEQGHLPAPLLQAALMYVDFLYGGDRGSTGNEVQIPPAIRRVCQLYRTF